MKRLVIVILSGVIILSASLFSFFYKEHYKDPRWNGKLNIQGTRLYNQFNEEIVLKGVSTHGIQWESDEIISKENIKTLKDDWNINVIRIAMYTAEDGYISDPENIKKKVYRLIDDCIQNNLYVVIDWHTLSDNNPNTYINEATSFFDELSKKYGNIPNVIYEICNEPNGDDVDWDDIYTYAVSIIKTIRNNDPDSIIIVGTANWCTDLLSPTEKMLPFDNVFYSYHFYSGTHNDYSRQDIEIALKKGLPIIVSEWGVTNVSNDDEVYLEEAEKWIDFLDERHIGHINWSFSNINESTSILKENATKIDDTNLTESGKFVKRILLEDK